MKTKDNGESEKKRASKSISGHGHPGLVVISRAGKSATFPWNMIKISLHPSKISLQFPNISYVFLCFTILPSGNISREHGS